MTTIMVILLVWQRHGASPPKWGNIFWMTPLIALAVFLHGVWYLWVLLVAAFFLAQQFRWCFLLAVSWILGTFLGSALTGHPIVSIVQAVQVALRAVGMHPTQNTLVTELRPSGGDIYTLLLIGGLIVLRQLAKLNAPPLLRHPAFWLTAIGWLLGCETLRFWEDWGLPALVILIDSADGAAQEAARALKAGGARRYAILAGGELILARHGQPGMQRAASQVVPQYQTPAPASGATNR